MSKLKNDNAISLYAISALFAYMVLNQGGYFAGAVISAGLIVILLLFRAKIQFRATEFVFFGFSLWFLFCSLRLGFDVRYMAKGLIPLLCLMFWILLPKDKQRAEELCEKVIKISFYITIFAIFVCAYRSFKSMRLRRLTFPFQYANASGIFFGVMFILARYSGLEWAKKRQYVFFLGLLCTQSVGAIGMTVLAEIVLSKNKKMTLAMILFLAVGAVFLRARVYQSMGTFIERFLQMYDGLLCMRDNFFVGIGSGRWELVKNLYQTGFYDAKEIHSSIVEIATASGIIGFGLFVLSIAFAFKNINFENKVYPVVIIMILGHSIFDFTFSFALFGFLIMIILSCGYRKEQKYFEFNEDLKLVTLAVVFVGFLTLSVGMYQIKKLDGFNITKRYTTYINYYETNILSQKSVKTTENYAKALYATGNKQKCLEILKNIDVLSSDMIILNKGCVNDWKEVIKHLEKQPYNSVLYKTVCYNSNDEALQKQSREMLDKAINSMSFFGKILFNFKGEKVL